MQGFDTVKHVAGVRGPYDAANARAIRCEDPILLCTAGPEATVTGILEATCKLGSSHNADAMQLILKHA